MGPTQFVSRREPASVAALVLLFWGVLPWEVKSATGGNLKKPAFRATERKDNDFCQEGHAHQSPGSQKSKTSNPDSLCPRPMAA